MRTIYFLLAGTALLLASIYFSALAGFNLLWLAIPIWVGIAAYNMYLGIAKAGYSVKEELPIFVAIAGTPIALAYLIQRFFF